MPISKGSKSQPTTAAVTGLAAGAESQTTVSLAWSGSSPKYNVYVNGVYVAQVATKSYVVSGLSCGTGYQLSVRGVSKTNRLSSAVTVSATTAECSAPPAEGSDPPPAGGFLTMDDIVAPGNHGSLPDSAAAADMITNSLWEPRPVNTKRNNVLINPVAAAAAFAARPLAVDNNYDPLWDSWLLPRVDGQFSGTTDEIFQWAAYKWGLSDELLRAIAVRESTWYQYLVYPNERPVVNWGCGDMFPAATAESKVFLDYVAGFGHDYQLDFGVGLGPKTYSIIGCMSWQAPSWGQMPNNQNGTFPFNRNSTAFAVDYLAGHLRGVYEGWEHWLASGPVAGYAAGDIWGAVGSWYSGDWHSAAANGYISRVQGELANTIWLSPDWPTNMHSVDPVYGVPQADGL